MKSIVFALLLIHTCVYAQSLNANKFLNLVIKENYDSAFLMFNQQQVSKEEFINALIVLKKQNGKILKHKHIANISPTHFVYEAKTDKQLICTVSIIFSDTLKYTIEGFWVDVKKYKKPRYAKTKQFSEQEFNIVSDGYKLFGTIATPLHSNSTIAILIHGSGKCDRDETIGGTKVFRDIAWGLSSNGISVIRYDKRTFTYDSVETLNGYSIYEEVINDAVNMINHFTEEKLTKQKVIIIGHSLGAMLAPLIAAKVKNSVAGIVLLASPARGLDTVLMDQLSYQLSNLKLEQPDIADLENEIVLTKNIGKLRSHSLKNDSLLMPLGYPVSYFNSIVAYNNVEQLKNTNVPVLVLWGDRDYQVNVKDFEVLKNTFKGNSNFSFKKYNGLNHIFVFGKGKSLPNEYEEINNVNEQIIMDINQWIKSLK